MPELGLREADERLDLLTLRDVHGLVLRRAAPGADGRDELLQPVGTTGPDHDARPVAGEEHRGRLADAAAGSRDHDDLLLDSGHDTSPWFRSVNDPYAATD